MNLTDWVRDLDARLRGIEAQARRARRGVFVPLAVTDLKDSGGTTWASAARVVGTYTFRPGDNASLWPSKATAVSLMVVGRWTAANNAYAVSLRRAAAGTTEGQVRAPAANIASAISMVVPLDASGYFYAVVEGADAAAATIRINGYYS